MRFRKILVAVAGASIAVVALAGCSGAADGSATTKAGPKVGLIMLQGDTYFQGIQSALEAAVKKDGGTVTAGVSNGDPATENQLAQNMIQAHVDAVLMQPAADEASVATMKAIKAAKVSRRWREAMFAAYALGFTPKPKTPSLKVTDLVQVATDKAEKQAARDAKKAAKKGGR